MKMVNSAAKQRIAVLGKRSLRRLIMYELLSEDELFKILYKEAQKHNDEWKYKVYTNGYYYIAIRPILELTRELMLDDLSRYKKFDEK